MLWMKKKPAGQAPSVRMPTSTYHGRATASVAMVTMPSRVVMTARSVAGRASVVRLFSVGHAWPRLCMRSATAIDQAQGSSTASGPTKPIGPLQSTPRPSKPPTMAARDMVIRSGAVRPGSGMIASATSSVAQVQTAVRIASGVAACDSMPTSRQPT